MKSNAGIRTNKLSAFHRHRLTQTRLCSVFFSLCRCGIWIKRSLASRVVETRGKRLNKAGINYPPSVSSLFPRHVVLSLFLCRDSSQPVARLNDENWGNFVVYFPCKRPATEILPDAHTRRPPADEITRRINRVKLIRRTFHVWTVKSYAPKLQCEISMWKCTEWASIKRIRYPMWFYRNIIVRLIIRIGGNWSGN